MSEVDYKKRYDDLKLKFLRSLDISWRLGYEQGLKDSQIEQMNQQMNQQNMMAQGQPQQDQYSAQQEQYSAQQGQDGQDGGVPSEQDVLGHTDEGQNVQENQDEMGGHLDELEAAIGKSELSPKDVNKLQKAIATLKAFSQRVSDNLPENSKKTHSLQQKIVENILDKWDNESKKSGGKILDIIGTEGDK